MEMQHIEEFSKAGMPYIQMPKQNYLQMLEYIENVEDIEAVRQAKMRRADGEEALPLELTKRGSLILTRPVLFDFIATRADLLAASADLFDVITSGAVNITIVQTFPLSAAADAQRALEARQTIGLRITSSWVYR